MHRIRLVGPWEAAFERVADGSDLPPELQDGKVARQWQRVKLPGLIDISTGAESSVPGTSPSIHAVLKDDRQGCDAILLRRKWNRPTGLTDELQLRVEFEGSVVPSQVHVNGVICIGQPQADSVAANSSAEESEAVIQKESGEASVDRVRAVVVEYSLPSECLAAFNVLTLRFDRAPSEAAVARLEIRNVALVSMD